jgi:hypothetical protein
MPTSVPSISPIVASPWPRPITTLYGVARLAAVKAVKQQMRNAGLKPVHVKHAVIVAAANAYLDQHREELLAEAAETIDRWPPFRKMAEQEAKRRRRPQVRTNGHQHRPWPAAVSVVHNSRPER